MSIWGWDECCESGDEGHRVEDELFDGAAGAFEGEDDAVVVELGEPGLCDGGSGHVAAQTFECGGAPRGNGDAGVQAEVVMAGAQWDVTGARWGWPGSADGLGWCGCAVV